MTAPATAATTPPPSSAGAPPTSTAEAPKTGAQDTGFRFTAGPGVKDWMVGKTPIEVANMSQQLYDAAIQAPPPRQTAPAPSGYQPPAPTAVLPPTQEEWQLDPYAASQKQQAYVNATQLQPAISQYGGMIAQTNRQMARMQYADDFRKWGPEIDLRLNQVQSEYMTPANIETVIQMVRGAHAHEIEQEVIDREIEKRMAGGALLRPGAGSQPSPQVSQQVDFTTLPPTYQDWLKRNNVNEQTLEEFLTITELRNRPGLTMNQAKTEWLDKAKKGDVLLEQPPSKTAVGEDVKGGR